MPTKAKTTTVELTAKQFLRRLEALRSEKQAQAYDRAFKTGDFLGVRMGQVFALAKEFVALPLTEIEKLLESPVHEARVGAVSVMDFQARSKKIPAAQKKALFELYIRRHDCINTWDLVDRSAIWVVGHYLFDKPRKILYQLAKSKMMAERRTAIVATLYFIGQNEVDDAFKLAEIMLYDQEDLIHKANGWALRFAGDKDRARLERFLDQHAATMPRITLRYALEHFDKKQRAHYLGLKSSPNLK
jgi:3-methyladenine DNA glycosylase AlkD